jgi:hypothetical protein
LSCAAIEQPWISDAAPAFSNARTAADAKKKWIEGKMGEVKENIREMEE